MSWRRFAKKALQMLPLKKHLFQLIRYASPPELLFRHLYFTDWFKVDFGCGKFLLYHYGFQLENQVFWRGRAGWEPASMRIWMQLSERSKVIMDIGSNTGLYALVARTVNRDAEIHCFEPVERVFEKLMRNIRKNRFDIQAVQLGLSNFTGTATLYDIPEPHVYSVTVNKNPNREGVPVVATPVSVIKLDDYVRQRDLKTVSLLKIDVETHEPEVLEGAIKIIRESRPSILVEVLTPEVGTRIMKLLERLDYVYFEVDEMNGPRLVENLQPRDHHNFLLYPGDPANITSRWNDKTATY